MGLTDYGIDNLGGLKLEPGEVREFNTHLQPGALGGPGVYVVQATLVMPTSTTDHFDSNALGQQLIVNP